MITNVGLSINNRYQLVSPEQLYISYRPIYTQSSLIYASTNRHYLNTFVYQTFERSG